MTLFGEVAAQHQSGKRAKMRENVQHHRFKMKAILDQMQKRQAWLTKAASALRYAHNNEPARTIVFDVADIGRDIEAINARLNNIQRMLGDPEL